MLFFILQCKLSAQITLSGMVKDEKAEPLIGATIYLKHANICTTTDVRGLFKISTQINDSFMVEVSYVGFENTSLKLSPQSQYIEIQLKSSGKELNQVVVSAGRFQQEIKRVTVSTDIIKPYLIQNKGTVNMEGIMNQLPGVNVIDGQVNIRGGSGWSYGAGSRVTVMVDDLVFQSADNGSVQWKFLPTENIEQMEVIKGASSVLYGSSALYGVVNIRTGNPKEKPQTKFNIISGVYDRLPRDSSRWSNNARLMNGFSAFHSQRFRLMDAVVAVNYLKDDGYRLGEDDERLRVSFKTSHRHKKVAGLRYGINGSVMTQNSSSFLIWESFTLGYTAQDSIKSQTNARLITIDPHLDFYTSRIHHKIRMRYNHTRNEISNGDTSSNQDNQFDLYLAEYQNQISLFKNRGTISSGIMGSFTTSNSPLYQGVHQIKNFAPYVQADLRFQKLSVSLGYRFEHFELDGKSEQASIIRTGLNYELTKATFLRASFGQGFRFPSIAERFITTSVGLLNVFANPELKAEKGWSSELAIKQGFKLGNQFSGFIDVAAFWTQYQNMIEFNFGLWKISPNVFDGIGFKAINVGETRITGLDFVVGTDGKIGAFTIRSLIGYTYTKPVSLDPDFIFAQDSFAAKYSHKSTSEDSTNNLLKYRYTHLFKYDIEVGYKKWILGISQRYNSYMTNVDGAFVKPIILNIYIVPDVERGRAMNPNGDLITDIRVGYKLNTKLNFQFLVNNLTNHEQMTRPGDLRPPRMFLFQVQYALQ